MSDRERQKKSWREIDAGRDRAGGRAPAGERPRSNPLAADRASKQYRAALDALFEKGEVGKLAEKLSPSSGASTPAATVVAEAPTRRTASTETPAPPPVDEGRAALRKRIVAAIGRDEISRAVDKYLKAHGMPPDFEILEQALDHVRPERVAEALAALDALLARERPKRSRTLASKLRLIEETSGDPELGQKAAAVRQKLGV